MDLKEAIYSRRAVREFTGEPVKDEVLRQLIDAAIQAPSAVNHQPWLFSVVRDKEFACAYLNRSESSHAQDLDGCGIASFPGHIEQFGFRYFLSCSRPRRHFGRCRRSVGCGGLRISGGKLMLTACAAGLGTCWIGFAQSWLGTPDGKAALKLSSTNVPVAPIIVGYPKTVPAPVPRRAAKINWIS